MAIPLYYYRNRSGLVAVSYDEGTHIIVPTGRILEVFDAWQDVVDDCYGELNADQLRTLERMKSVERDDPIGHIINRYARDRRDVERRDGTGDAPNFRIRPVPEWALVVAASFNQKD